MSELINRVAQSPIVSFNVETLYPKEDRIEFDLKDFLFEGLVLKEKDFRADLKAHDWTAYQSKWVAVNCSADAIVPTWAFMLVASYLNPYTKGFVVGSLENLEQSIVDAVLSGLDLEEFRDRPVVIKGCSSVSIPLYFYGEVIRRLQPLAKSLLFGEPCSTVPIFKKPKKA